MKLLRNTVIRAGLEALYFSGAHYLLRPIFAGVGVIFMLHHVRPSRDGEFQPNHHLEVEPEFLRAMLAHLRSLDVDIVTMDEVHQRLQARNFARRFACFTLDDGYRDNRDFALPVMREFDAPLTVYVTSDFAEGTGRLWWVALERAIAKASAIEVPIGGVTTRLDASTPAAKQAAFDRMHDWLRALPTEHDMQREISALCTRYDVDETTIARELCMSWDELKAFADDPLVTIGAHTITHCNLAQAERGDRFVRTGHQPRADRSGAAAAGASSRLSLWRPHRGRPARIHAGEGGRIQDRGDDAAGHDLPGKRRSPDRAAAGFAQRQLPGRAHPPGPDLRRRHRDVERLSPHRRGVDFIATSLLPLWEKVAR